jgi:hypothetical protein
MTNKWLFCLFLVAAILLAASLTLGGAQRSAYPETPAYNLKAERLIEGTIAGKGHIMDGLMYFPLKTKDKVLEMQVGHAEEFLEKDDFSFDPGETVRVIGVVTVIDSRVVILAREIRSMKGIWRLRDQNGTPIWEIQKPIQMDPERKARPFEPCGNLRRIRDKNRNSLRHI